MDASCDRLDKHKDEQFLNGLRHLWALSDCVSGTPFFVYWASTTAMRVTTPPSSSTSSEPARDLLLLRIFDLLLLVMASASVLTAVVL